MFFMLKRNQKLISMCCSIHNSYQELNQNYLQKENSWPSHANDFQ